MPQPTSNVSRRQFLRSLGIVGAAATVPGLLAACGDGGNGAPTAGGGGSPATTGGGGGQPLKVGLLVPQSGTYAPLGEDMIQGFQLYLDANGGALGGRPVEVVTAETEANPEVGIRGARRLLEEDQVQVVTGIVSSAVAYGVKDIFGEAGVPLILSNAGANEVNLNPTLPNLFRVSFTNRQPNFALGQWAAEEYAGETFACIAPDYAAGQEHVQGFIDGFGGDIAAEIYPPFGTTTDYQPFLSELRQSGATAVQAFFAGGEAITFVQQYANFGLKEQMPLIGSGFLTDGAIIAQQGEAATGLRTALHYSTELESERNQAFSSAYSEAYGDTATTYVMQSYDAAQLIDLALADGDVDTGDPEAFSEALAGVGTIPSPRGDFELSDDIHDPIQPVYLREVQDVEGTLANVVLDDLGEFQPLPEA